MLLRSGHHARARRSEPQLAAAATAEVPYDAWGLRESLRQSDGDSFALKQAALDAPGLFDSDESVNFVTVDDATNTTLVGLGVDNAENRAAVRKALGAKPSEVSFTEMPVFQPAEDRNDDANPFNAGSAIFNQSNGGMCTSGGTPS